MIRNSKLVLIAGGFMAITSAFTCCSAKSSDTKDKPDFDYSTTATMEAESDSNNIPQSFFSNKEIPFLTLEDAIKKGNLVYLGFNTTDGEVVASMNIDFKKNGNKTDIEGYGCLTYTNLKLTKILRV